MRVRDAWELPQGWGVRSRLDTSPPWHLGTIAPALGTAAAALGTFAVARALFVTASLRLLVTRKKALPHGRAACCASPKALPDVRAACWASAARHGSQEVGAWAVGRRRPSRRVSPFYIDRLSVFSASLCSIIPSLHTNFTSAMKLHRGMFDAFAHLPRVPIDGLGSGWACPRGVRRANCASRRIQLKVPRFQGDKVARVRWIGGAGHLATSTP